ncbi:MAG: tyrosine-type recombinase/integrase [Flavobacteriaceae bacterium]
MELSYPKVKRKANGDYFIEFTLKSKRIRLLNGQKIKSQLRPNDFPVKERKEKAKLLAKNVYDYLKNNNYSFDSQLPKNELELYDKLVSQKLSEPLSIEYKRTIESIANDLRWQVVLHKTIPIEFTNNYLNKYNNPTSFNTIRRHLNALLNYLKEYGFEVQSSSLKPRKQTERLHKPIENIVILLNEVRSFNTNLYICCLLTYGCLLRPHREVRQLRWGDFTDDLKYISIGGNRVKSRRNRIVPVPEFIREQLSIGKRENNIFSNTPIEFNKDYFKTLWGRYKRTSKVIELDQTLYSFRHSGAIDIFKRTGSITKLQKAMGHSSINVSLTYLRGLEVPELNEEDMPMI